MVEKSNQPLFILNPVGMAFYGREADADYNAIPTGLRFNLWAFSYYHNAIPTGF
jgi:hypothetical protein